MAKSLIIGLLIESQLLIIQLFQPVAPIYFFCLSRSFQQPGSRCILSCLMYLILSAGSLLFIERLSFVVFRLVSSIEAISSSNTNIYLFKRFTTTQQRVPPAPPPYPPPIPRFVYTF
jgi:glucan phosphoethanolaminetransferase (alkaline phosphatase superfamily)